MSLSNSPTMAEMLAAVLRSRLAQTWTSLPGIVESYDATTQKASVRPAVDNRLETVDGEELLELPVIKGVPIVWPSGGGFFVTLPLAQGDPVLLVFASRSVDAWKAGDGKAPVDPNDLRTHDLSDAFAIPGGKPFGATLGEASAEDLVLGKDGGGPLLTLKADGSIIVGRGAADFVALAPNTEARLAALEAFAATHTHPGCMPGPSATGPAPGAPTSSGPVAATKVRAI